MAKIQAREIIRSKALESDFSFEDLKEFKETLDKKNEDLISKEKEISEKEKTISKVLTASKKMNSEIETYKMEIELILKEKKALQDDYEHIKNIVTQMTLEREQNTKKVKWLEELVETKSEGFSSVQRKDDEIRVRFSKWPNLETQRFYH